MARTWILGFSGLLVAVLFASLPGASRAEPTAMVEVRRSRPVANGNGEADGSTDSADASEADGAKGEERGLLPFLPEWAPLGPPSGDPNSALQPAPPRP
ncbi:MAG: hypothetical protein ACYS22_11530, partial [Planctomycetota bacterium]